MDEAVFVPARHKLDVEGYHLMGRVGILGVEDRVELVGGEIYDMAPIGSDHATTVDKLTLALVLACRDQAIVRVQNPIRLDRLNEPQPDFAVCRNRRDWYRSGHPGGGDVLLVVEVADSSLRFDRTVKLPLYAGAGVGEVWIVDLERRVVDAHRDPAAGGYAKVETYPAGAEVALAMMPEIRVALVGVFD